MNKTTNSIILIAGFLVLLPFSSAYGAQPYTVSSVSYGPGNGLHIDGLDRTPRSSPGRTVARAVPARTPSVSGYSQVTAVAATVTNTNVPQLPKTGGGGKATAGKSPINSHNSLVWSGVVLVLALGILLFSVIRNRPEDQFESAL